MNIRQPLIFKPVMGIVFCECLCLNVVFNSDSETFSRLVKLRIASSLAKLLLVIWAPVGGVASWIAPLLYFIAKKWPRQHRQQPPRGRKKLTLLTISKAKWGATLGSKKYRGK